MRDAVRARWIEFTEPLEGGVPWLYADVRGLITIAFGNLVDPLSSALTLPLMHPGGVRATKNDTEHASRICACQPEAGLKAGVSDPGDVR